MSYEQQSGAQRIVRAVYPSAFDCYHTDHEVFKVYHLIGGCWVALSAGKRSKSEAWEDAAVEVERKEASAVTEQVLVSNRG